jgi:hypothetical protein
MWLDVVVLIALGGAVTAVAFVALVVVFPEAAAGVEVGCSTLVGKIVQTYSITAKFAIIN